MYGLVTCARAKIIGAFIVTASLFSPATQALVISQVYGGGGNSGATYTHDYIELFNDSSTTVDLGLYSVQYTAATGTSWKLTALSGLLDPYHYFLLQEAKGSGGSTALPSPDGFGTLALSAGSGKVALVKGVDPLSGCGDPLLVDLVGYGKANCFEGSGAAPTLSNTLAAWRLLDGLQDTGDNAFDFMAAAPAPRNAGSPDNHPSVAAKPLAAPSSLWLMLAGGMACLKRLRRTSLRAT